MCKHPLSAQCICVNITILSCESKIHTQTLTGSVINQVMHHYQGVVKGMGPENGEFLIDNCPALSQLFKNSLTDCY